MKAGIDRFRNRRSGPAPSVGRRRAATRLFPWTSGGIGKPAISQTVGMTSTSETTAGRRDALELGERRDEDQRDVDGCLVDEEAVGRLLVLAQAFAVVAGEDQEGVLDEAVGFEELPEPAELGIGEGDLAEIGMVGVCLSKGGGRLVGRMRVVEMDPGEEFLALVLPRARAGPRR